MLETQMLKVLADELFEAERAAKPIEPLSSRVSNLSVDDAYRIQLLGHERRLGPNRRVAVKKIGLTNVAMQKVFGVSEPDYGRAVFKNQNDSSQGRAGSRDDAEGAVARAARHHR